MTATLTRTRLLASLLAVSAIVLVLIAAGGVVPGLFSDDSSDRPDEPTTEGTVGYVDGYWYDDELSVDDRDDAVLEDDELDAVVARSMARVEEIRNLTFEDDVPVDVISREEFQTEHDDIFVELSEDEQRKQNVTYEALFMVDRDTDAADELEAMYGGSVDGYYAPSSDQIVLVSDNPETPELDEVVLGHELVHALQDQHYDLTSYDRETIDQDNAKNGLIEGDAVWVDTEYEQRCGDEWGCVLPADSDPDDFPELNWGIYMTLFQPYSDGPAYVDHLLETDDGWSAVDAAYDDPPTSSSTVIHHEEREPADTTVEDRSNESWTPLEFDGEVARETTGEATMVAMLGANALSPDQQPSVIESEALLTDDLGGFDYDQPYTDGWAGDELVTYIDATAEEPGAADSGYVWETEWRSSEDAREFATGYLELLDIHDAEPIEDRQDSYVIDEAFPGAYYLERDGETVTVVRAPSVAELDGIVDGAAPAGEDTLERVSADDSADDDTASSDDDDGDDSLAGFAAPGAVVAISLALLVARARVTPRTRVSEPSRRSVSADSATSIASEIDPGRVDDCRHGRGRA
ncbi:Hvo_1808 family surface protein [Natronorubrum halalkaliphilum]|uniref:Hvo_1808 family surface protein n=1 Tax=Natronorubrum halalkaliphilum TaxID=2691917 RepID=UPI0019165C06|nr:Hvo_1808 family surface protein [Natronorubrum halalkaliphilum]